MISIWSLFSATLWFVFAFFLLFLLRDHTSFLMYHGTAAWSIAVILTIIRLLLPLDSEYMIVIRSYTILPIVNHALRYEPSADISIASILAGFWILGTILGLVLLTWGIIRDRQRLRKLPVVPLTPQAQAAIQTCGIDPSMVRITPAITAPISAGFLHPRIYLPDMEYADADLVWILKHEISHITGHDAWWKLGFLLFRCFFWWNPFVHLAQKNVDDILELRCDKNVLCGVAAGERVTYAEALCHVAQQAHENIPSFVGAGPFVHPRHAGTLALRVQLALEAPKRRDRTAALVVILSFALFLVSYIFILQPAGFPAKLEDGIEMQEISTQTSYLKRLPSGDYELWCNGESFGTVRFEDLQDEMYQGLEVLS